MAASNTVLRIAELDFDTIKTNLKEYFRSQSQFTEYDFEGSGLNILLDALAYNTHYMAYYLNMVGNEMFLDTAILRNSIVSHSKHLNYVPTSTRAATAIVDVVVQDNTPTTGQSVINLPAYSTFQSQQIEGVNYTFVNLDSYVATKNVMTNTFTFSNVILKQGETITYNVTVDATNTRRRFRIPSSNIDTSTLIVNIITSSTDATQNVFTLADDATTLDSNSKVYFLEEGDDYNYNIYFGDGEIGKYLSDDNIVSLRYLSTDGESSNKANLFSFGTSSGSGSSQVGYYSNVIVNSVSAAAGGSSRDSIEKIKFIAPKFYNTQNRAVTKSDYGTLLLKDYPNIETISVWGGEENDPIVYGKIFVSMKPKNGYVITDIEKDRIISELISNRNVLTVIPEIVDPDYLYLRFDMTINYDSTLTSIDEEGLKQLVRSEVSTYNDTELENFNSTYRTSKLQNLINDVNPSFLGVDITTIAQKRLEPTLNETKNYVIDFNIPLNRGTFADRLYTYPSFQVLDNEGVSRDTLIEETPLSYTGVDSVEVLSSGSGYTDSPTVTITGDGSGAKAKAVVVNGKVISIEILATGSNYTAAVVTITDSTGTGATATAILSGQIGILRSYYVQTSTGEKIIINENIGRIDYTTGKINLYNFKPISVTSNPNYPSGVITFNALPKENTIHPLRNRLLSIDPDDPIAIQIHMENEA